MGKSIVYEVRNGDSVMDFVVSKDDIITEAIPATTERYFVGKRFRRVFKELKKSNPFASYRFVAVFS